MGPGKPLCRLCERPAADGGYSAAELDREKFAEWCLNYLGETLADELEDEDLVCNFCVWDVSFLLQNSNGYLNEFCWWPNEALEETNDDHRKTRFDHFSKGKMKQCWVPLEKMVESNQVEGHLAEEASEELAKLKLKKCIYCKNSFARTSALVGHITSIHGNIAIRCNFQKMCAEYFLTIEDRDIHIQNFHSKRKQNQKFYRCIYCSDTYLCR
ncbi:uncharacterized protein LOC132197532 [Neocloeon triangulifer]|uniref:uncharacterized protein LOC132197532 n=1 Tax=Neocloeon triangulifer TaxID=2078957 RepID=UPI00286EC850|nr:uncharacterized protein LOC132197532 [Neocloeon triangulifer]